MRKIKFRAWDYYGKKMYEVDELSFDDDGTIHGLLKDDYYGRVYFNEDCTDDGEPEYFILMQFTGIQDAKRTKEFPSGKDIYENDVLPEGRVFWSEEWGGWFVDNGEHEEIRPLCDIKEPVVICHIYQRPELLEG